MKRVKTFIPIIFVILFAVLATACGKPKQASNTAADPAIGTYTLVSYKVDGEEQDISAFTSQGIYSTLELRSDGTGTFDAFGTIAEFTWDKSRLIFDEGVSNYVLNGDVMTVTDGPSVMVFERTGKKEQPAATEVMQTDKASVRPEEGVNVMSLDANPIEWETYKDLSVIIQIPKGWTVNCTTPDEDMFRLEYEVKSPESIGCRIVYYVQDPNGWYGDKDFVNTQIENMKNSGYPDQVKAAEHLRYMPETSVKGYCEGAAEWDGGSFEVLEETKLEEVSYYEATDFYHQYDVARIHGKRTASDGNVYEGYYRASVYGNDNDEPLINPVTGKPWTYPVHTVSSVRILEAPADDFEKWLPVLQKTLNSIEFTEIYSSSLMTAVSAKSAALADTMSSPTYMEKTSDSIFGYERVYDTETGDVYMADYGFMEEYDKLGGKRYASISDDMYLQDTKGFVSLN